MFKMVSSFFTDKRLPHFLPYTITKKVMIKKNFKEFRPKEIKVALSFDIEKDPVTETVTAAKSFLREVNEIFKKKNIESTFFVQADLIRELVHQIRKLKRTEIGLHGFSHELWGDEKWWIRKPVTSIRKKEELLELSLDEFKKYKLGRPLSFRAPYMIINEKTLTLLDNFGFKVDSSLPSYEGILPVPVRISDSLISIPVSVNPEPKFSFRSMIPYCYYEIFNTETLKRFNKKDFLEFVQRVFYFQNLCDCEPHLLFLAHPWEFMKNKNLKYCTTKNYQLLKNVCSELENNYKVKYVTISKLAKVSE